MKKDASTKWKPIDGEAESWMFDFQTPVPVANYMVSLLPDGIRTVLEPTPGIGNIQNALKEKGYEVTAPSDYFLLPSEQRFDAVVMNPPFSHKFTILKNAPQDTHKAGMRMGYWFVTDCMLRRSDVIIALVPWFTISDSDVRLRNLYRYGLVSVTALPRRTFRFARIQTCVLHLEKGFKGETVFKAFDCLNDNLQLKIA